MVDGVVEGLVVGAVKLVGRFIVEVIFQGVLEVLFHGTGWTAVKIVTLGRYPRPGTDRHGTLLTALGLFIWIAIFIIGWILFFGP